MTDSSHFGPTVRAIRLENKVALREVARILGWSAAYVSDIELGRRNPPAKRTQIHNWGITIGAKDIPGLIALAAASRRMERRCPDCPLRNG